MAIFHLSVKTVSRSTGRSAVAAAAYRTGDTLTNERDGRQHDYANRTGVDDSFIIAPTGCEWAHNRSALWNAAEQTEKRSNSVTAREYVLALPAELDAKDRADLARSFASAVVERYGVAADVALHAPSAGGDDRNYHAHILTTTREVEPDGLGKKTRILDAAKTGGPEIESLRELWAMQCNEALERHQKPARIDHRSYERQGVDEMPTMHLGPTSTTMERKHKAEQERKGEPYKPQTFKAQENERRRTLNDHVREMVRELAATVREVTEQGQKRQKEPLLKHFCGPLVLCGKRNWRSRPDGRQRPADARRSARKFCASRHSGSQRAACAGSQGAYGRHGKEGAEIGPRCPR
ncbi:MobQ family relaxase [Acetobacter oryzifermentans]|uniref:MobQ family relaxase n=1 Tax=Acetobacter oryzifermentans TaxID=1633874 RepID=UPI003464AF2B